MNDIVRRHLLRQAGTISRDQAGAAGLTRRQIGHLLATREWLEVQPSVYRLHAAVPLPETGLWAAHLLLGGDVRLADDGATWWWGIIKEPPAGWTFVGRTGRRPRGDVRVVDAHVHAADRCTHRGIPLLSKPWAVLRTAASREDQRPGSGIALIDQAKQTRAVRQHELEQALDRHAGCWGSRTMRTLLRRTGDGAQSELERVAVSLLRAAGVTGFELNLTIRLSSGRAVEIDIAFPGRRIAIELDGYAFHSGAGSFRKDVRRLNALLRDGWTVRRFTWDDLVSDPEGFVTTVVELLAL